MHYGSFVTVGMRSGVGLVYCVCYALINSVLLNLFCVCMDLGVTMLFSGTLPPSRECAAAETRTAFRCDVTLICLAVSMATVWLVAGGWQSNGTNVQVRVLNETTGPQLEIVQISPTAGDYRCMCLSLSLAFRLSLCISLSLIVCLRVRQSVCF